eukprot:scaffold216349_cov37-Attheya_sp.AAC.1
MREIPYEIGVKQGDNMAPVLFIYLMNAFAETLSEKWTFEKWNINGFQQPRMGIGTGDSQDRVRRQKALFSTFFTFYMWTTEPCSSTIERIWKQERHYFSRTSHDLD